MPVIIPAKGFSGAVAGALLEIAGPGHESNVQSISRPVWAFEVTGSVYLTAMDTIPDRFITGVPDLEPEPETILVSRFTPVEEVVSVPAEVISAKRRGRPKKKIEETVS